MKGEKDLRLSNILINWYAGHQRDLPWRHTRDPYLIWLSEIILQQTRVDQGLSYYLRFVHRYPTVTDLAEAQEDEVLKLWQGLGYYSRARNLHAAAKTIVDKFGGKFPREYKDVLSLKGVGEYTAAAIVSFAYNDPYSVVDGNVYRVLSRVYAIDTPIDSTEGKKVFAGLAQDLLDDKHSGLHNQAIMEFGALQCVPSSPDCGICPLSVFCFSYAACSVARYPVKQGKTKVRNRYFNYFDVRLGNSTYINKRTAKDIWQNLYELPLIETTHPVDLEELQSLDVFKQLFGDKGIKNISFESRYKHILSHQHIHASFYRIELSYDLNSQYREIHPSEIGDYAVPQLIHRYLSEERA